MKKKIVMILTCAGIMAMSPVLAGCGAEKGEKAKEMQTQTEQNAGTERSEVEELTEETESAYTKYYETLSEYVEANQSVINEAVSTLDTAEYSAEITAEGNLLVYTFIYKDFVVEDGDTTVSEALKQSSAEQESAFRQNLEELQEEIEEKIGLKIVYLDSTGKELFSSTYTND